MLLTPADLRELTGRTRYRAQGKVLDALGIRYSANTGENDYKPLIFQNITICQR